MKSYSLSQLTEILSGDPETAPTSIILPSDEDGKTEIRIENLLTDSRSLGETEGTLFVALSTRLGDGHKYIGELYDKGVRAFLVEKLPDNVCAPGAAFIVTPSVRKALARIVSSKAGDFSGISAIITGSRGKTTVKELLYQALLPVCEVRRSPRSWNSSIGVPLSVWEGAEENVGCLITEAGIDGPGQSAQINALLSGSLAPTTGIITPITTEHDNAFASHADKVREKIKLVEHCDTIIYDDSDPVVGEILRTSTDPSRQTLVAVSNESHPECPTVLHAITLEALKALSPQLGIRETPAALLRGVPSVSTRIDIIESSNGCTLLFDKFTADLRSLADALDFMRRRMTPQQSRILILGDLAHGEADSDALVRLYTRAFNMASTFGIERIIAVGDEVSSLASSLGESFPDAVFLRDENEFSKLYPAESFSNAQILIKGKPGNASDAILTSLENAWHDTVYEIDLDALVHNYNYYRSLVRPGTEMVAMVKASAYGMGALEVAKSMQDAGAAYLAVAVVDEGVALRQAGITMPIIILNPITNSFRSLFAFNLEPTVFSLPELERIITEARNYGAEKYPVHIKLDTGMHRVGFLEEDLDRLAEVLSGVKEVEVSSVFSHLATADCLDMDDYTNGQIRAYVRMSEKLRHTLGTNFKRHLLNTAGMMRFAYSLDYEMGRLGIGLYGISPYDTDLRSKLKPVARLASSIISIKHWPAGTPIGYGCRGVTSRDSVIATVAAGYADGIDRHLGRGNAYFIVRGAECPTIGNICMDQCMIDVTDAPEAAVGDEVEIFGPSAPVERLAEILDTIPYEIITSVSQRVKRRYFRK